MANDKRVLITGGAGFIGSHAADELLSHGWRVRALDNLHPQVHGADAGRPDYLADDVELLVGDVRDAAAVRRALDGVDAVVHLAAAVGVGQSMYQIADYVSANALGTGVLLEALIERPVQSLVVASSMSIYGEGLYQDAEGRQHQQVERTREQLRAEQWEPTDEQGRPLTPVPTPEWKRPTLASVYALSKYDQERLCLMTGDAYGMRTVALRFFNVYGPRQALSNPYTGVLAIFGSRLLNGKPPLVFEDGEQQRDFVSVHDIAQGIRRALSSDAHGVFNLGSGEAMSILDIGRRLATALGRDELEPRVTGQARVGDIRHCFADISLARAELGYAPAVSFEDGVAELTAWLADQQAEDKVESAHAELQAKGLTV